MLPIRRHLLLILLLLAGIADVQARNGQPRNQAPIAPPPSSQSVAPPPAADSSLPASVRRVEKETGGEVLRAEPIQASGREVYRIKVLTPQGRIREVRDDPRRHGKDKDRQPESSDSEDDDDRSQ